MAFHIVVQHSARGARPTDSNYWSRSNIVPVQFMVRWNRVKQLSADNLLVLDGRDAITRLLCREILLRDPVAGGQRSCRDQAFLKDPLHIQVRRQVGLIDGIFQHAPDVLQPGAKHPEFGGLHRMSCVAAVHKA